MPRTSQREERRRVNYIHTLILPEGQPPNYRCHRRRIRIDLQTAGENSRIEVGNGAYDTHTSVFAGVVIQSTCDGVDGAHPGCPTSPFLGRRWPRHGFGVCNDSLGYSGSRHVEMFRVVGSWLGLQQVPRGVNYVKLHEACVSLKYSS